MTEPKSMPGTEWRAIKPGLMELPQTKFLIEYVAASIVPFRATWNGSPFPNSARCTLADAQSSCREHMAELITMGFEV